MIWYKVLGLGLLLVVPNLQLQTVETEPVAAELVAEVESIQPGRPFWVALRLQMKEHWHTYWRNPGDSGLGTTIVWTLPDGFRAGPIRWPYPQRIELPSLVNYGYEGEVFLLTEIETSPSLRPGTEVELTARARWLVCREICLPGEARLQIRLPVRDTVAKADPRWVEAFAATRARLPQVVSDWRFGAILKDRLIVLEAMPPAWFKGTLSNLYFFPEEPGLIEHAAPQALHKSGSGYCLEIKRDAMNRALPGQLRGVLVVPQGRSGPGLGRALRVDVPLQTE